MPIPAFAGGHLPVGRHVASDVEVAERFVEQIPRSATRSDQWRDFLRARASLEWRFDVRHVWIGGSFASETLHPRDIDLTVFIDERTISSPQEIQAADQRLRQMFPLVDAALTLWGPVDHPELYFRNRGYWDHHWQLTRSAEGDPWDRQSATRGYLEVRP